MKKLKKHWQKWGDGMDLISREALKELLQHKRNSLQGIGGDEYALKAFDYCIKRINEQPTIEAVPVVHGEWVNGKCSNCGEYIPTDTRIDFVDEEDCAFCYSCGADMRKKV